MDKKRPKPKSMVQYDSNNYYSQLGISPLTSTEEIKAITTQKGNQAKSTRRGQTTQGFGAAEENTIQFQKIENIIGNPKGREQYDFENPQNQILTVQPSIYDRWLESKKQCDLVTLALVEIFGQESILPDPNAIPLWLPTGIDPGLENILKPYLQEQE